jgi:NitT/TauT family transport system substrate-binding protein
MIPRRVTLLGGVAAVATALTAGGAAAQTGQPGGLRTLTIKAAAPSLTTAVQLAMVARKLDAAHGFRTDLQASGTSSTVTIDAVLSGQADFGSPGTADALQAIRQGAELVIIAAVANNLQTMVIRNDVMARIGVPPTAPIADRVHALKGLTVATGAVGSTHYQILRAYLRQYGVNPDTDLRLIGIADTSALITGITHARYDAVAYASGVVEQTVADDAATVWISGPRGDIPGSDDVKTCVIVARADMVQKRRADIDAFRAALQDALQAVNGDHGATGRVIHDVWFPKLNPVVWDLAWNGATRSYPRDLAFTRAAYDYWIANDPKGAASYRDVDYAKVTYAAAQAP